MLVMIFGLQVTSESVEEMKIELSEDDFHILKICFEYASEQLEKEISDCGIEWKLQQLRKEWLTKIQLFERNINARIEE